jgi:predicted phage terminase large subunit-like protein
MHAYLFQRCAEIVDSPRETRDAIAAPRANAKSTIATLAFVLWVICTRARPYPFIVIIGDTFGQASDFIEDIKQEVETNEALRADFGIAQGPTWTQRQVIISTPQGDVKILALGTGGKIRGRRFLQHRPKLVVLDDPENDDNARSILQCDNNHAWLTKAVLKAGDPGRCKYLHLGTVLNDSSLLARNLRNPGWRSVKYKALIQEPHRQDLWADWEKLRLDPLDEARDETARAFYEANHTAMDEGAEVLWPEGESLYALMDLRAVDGAAAFASEKQNDPYDPSLQIFNMDKAGKFTLYPDRLETDDGRRVFLHELTFFGYHDPAMGHPDGDFAAIVTIGVDRHGIVYVVDAWVHRRKPNEQIKRAFDFNATVKYERYGFESNGFQEFLKGDFDKEADSREREGLEWQLPIQLIKNTKAKEYRIVSIEPKISNRFMLFNRNLSQTFMDQMRHYKPKGPSHDDGPDALAGAYALASRGLGLARV